MQTELNYRRTVEELRELASMFWPSELSAEAAKLSVITIIQTIYLLLNILNGVMHGSTN